MPAPPAWYRATAAAFSAVTSGSASLAAPTRAKTKPTGITLFSGATFTSTVQEPLTRCTCGYEGTEIFVCPTCGALPQIEKGKEIVVTNIEIEADDA